MIHMLSRFDLAPGVTLKVFSENYDRLFGQLRNLDLVETTGAVGERVADTPMDTDAVDAPRYYVVMSFRDRAQLDASYAYFAEGAASPDHVATHLKLNRGAINHVFTCWEDAD